MDTASDWRPRHSQQIAWTQHVIGSLQISIDTAYGWGHGKLVLHSISKTSSTNIGSIHEPSCMIGYKQYEYLSTK